MIPEPERTAEILRKRTSLRPTLGIVLGSGFRSFCDSVRLDSRVPFHKLPGFPRVSVPGHSGEAVTGYLRDTPVVVLAGRAHYYEGFSLAEVTYPVRVLAAFGIRTLLLTNAAGAINPRFRQGDFMCLADHINLMGENPLRGQRDAKRFVDLSQTYHPGLNKLLGQAARDVGVRIHFGIYLAVSGPSYETPAEIRAFRKLGADAVGMSTVPEAIVARQCGVAIAALSCLTNFAAGRTRHPISHAEVLATGERVQADAVRLILRFVDLFTETPCS